MGVKVKIPAMLRRLTEGEATLTVEGATVAEIIDNMEADCQGISKELIDSKGEIHRYVNIYINNEDIRFLDKLETSVAGDDVISILPAVAGG